MQSAINNATSSCLDPSYSILIVDDEQSIRKSLEGIFKDEGFSTYTAQDGEAALGLLKLNKPSVILLDIWMPGVDGLEMLSTIKQMYPDVPVIMISGHATIATAVRATQLGAQNFIEKPLDLEATLHAVRHALKNCSHETRSRGFVPLVSSGDTGLEITREWGKESFKRLAFSSQAWRGKAIPQKTLANTALLYGQGLHSGKKSGLILEPLPPSTGIHFAGISESAPVPAHVSFVESTGFATALRLGNTQASTIEHIMSALHAYGISNLLIKCNGEVPVMDGSALEFCALFDEIGLEKQAGEWYAIEVKEKVRVDRGEEFIQIEPHNGFVIDYTLSYPKPVGEQRFTFALENVDEYKKEIAPARTFGFVKDIGALQKQGLALGGRFDNVVLIGERGVINGSLRFPEELVRHKILDLIGDLYLLGRPIFGKVTAFMTGHSDNVSLLEKILEKMN